MPKFVEGYADKLLVPEGKDDVQVFDSELPGFGIRKFANSKPSKKYPKRKPGRASYFVKFNVGSQQRRKTLGKVVHGNLKDMRKLASLILAEARLGTDVVAEQKAVTAKSSPPTLGQLVPLYLAARATGEDDHSEVKKLRPRSLVETTRYLERSLKPLHALPINAITRNQIDDALNDLVHVSGKVSADRARGALSGLCGWAITRRYLDTNPTADIASRAKNVVRKRHLKEPELAEVWNACLDDDYGRIVRLLILTGQRRQEIGNLAWSEIDLDEQQFELPEERTKNKLPHIVPLSAQALAILESTTQEEGRDLVFGGGAGGFSGWSKAKKELDTRIATARKAAGVRKPMEPWVLQDLRRTVVTGLLQSWARLVETPNGPEKRTGSFAKPHVVEAVVNHISGHKAGVAGVYNEADYLPEKREALALWGAHVASLVTGKGGPLIREQKVSIEKQGKICHAIAQRNARVTRLRQGDEPGAQSHQRGPR